MGLGGGKCGGSSLCGRLCFLERGLGLDLELLENLFGDLGLVSQRLGGVFVLDGLLVDLVGLLGDLPGLAHRGKKVTGGVAVEEDVHGQIVAAGTSDLRGELAGARLGLGRERGSSVGLSLEFFCFNRGLEEGLFCELVGLTLFGGVCFSGGKLVRELGEKALDLGDLSLARGLVGSGGDDVRPRRVVLCPCGADSGGEDRRGAEHSNNAENCNQSAATGPHLVARRSR